MQEQGSLKLDVRHTDTFYLRQCTMSGILTLETTIKDHSVDQSTALWLSNREIRAAITAESETLAKSYNDIMEAINNISKNTSREIVMQRSVTPMKFSVEPDAVDERLLSVNERGSAGDFLMRL